MDDREKNTVHMFEYSIVEKVNYTDINIFKVPFLLEKKITKIQNTLYINPEMYIPELQKLVKKFPKIGILGNLLCLSYNLTGQESAYIEEVKRNYKDNPDYLFAKIGYVQHLIDENDLDGVDLVLNKCFDLGLLYPNRREFSINEFIVFSVIIIQYCLKRGDEDKKNLAHELRLTIEKHFSDEKYYILLIQEHYKKLDMEKDFIQHQGKVKNNALNLEK